MMIKILNLILDFLGMYINIYNRNDYIYSIVYIYCE